MASPYLANKDLGPTRNSYVPPHSAIIASYDIHNNLQMGTRDCVGLYSYVIPYMLKGTQLTNSLVLFHEAVKMVKQRPSSYEDADPEKAEYRPILQLLQRFGNNLYKSEELGMNAVMTTLFGNPQFENSHLPVYVNVTVDILHFLTEFQNSPDPNLQRAIKLFALDKSIIIQDATPNNVGRLSYKMVKNKKVYSVSNHDDDFRYLPKELQCELCKLEFRAFFKKVQGRAPKPVIALGRPPRRSFLFHPDHPEFHTAYIKLGGIGYIPLLIGEYIPKLPPTTRPNEPVLAALWDEQADKFAIYWILELIPRRDGVPLCSLNFKALVRFRAHHEHKTPAYFERFRYLDRCIESSYSNTDARQIRLLFRNQAVDTHS